MPTAVIHGEGLGKRYRRGLQVDGGLRHSLEAFLRSPVSSLRRKTEETFWALKDVSLEVKEGEVLGLIGRNGAGKTTLLKILSRITRPTEGWAEIHGRVGSLLEVGTGFHPELTGRENTFLSGAILGMGKAEIERKFDEIVAFAEIERFLDTPVKWYSTGMHARLAFSVAAHLEPDVLIVDEVLAVGDAGFQRKCLTKMGTVAAGGRTVLFVSHNMQAISQLTNRCLVLNAGTSCFDGPTPDAVKMYQSFQEDPKEDPGQFDAPLGMGHNHVASAHVRTSEPKGKHQWGEPLTFEFMLEIHEPYDSLCFSFQVLNEHEQPVCHFWLYDANVAYRRQSGVFRLQCHVPKFRLYMGSYTVRTWLTERRSSTTLESLQGICPFEVTMQGIHRDEYQWEAGSCIYLEDATWLTVDSHSAQTHSYMLVAD